MKFDKVIKSILKEELSREDKIKALKNLKNSDVKVIYFNIDKKENGYPEKRTRIVAVEFRENYNIDDVYKDILADTGLWGWGTILNDGWGDWKNNVRFITNENVSEKDIFLFAFLIPSSNTDWFTEFDKLDGTVDEDGLQYIDSDSYGYQVPSGWDIGIKEAWDEYVADVLYDYGWLDQFRN